MGLDENQCLLLIEMYIKYALGSLIIVKILRRLALVIWDKYSFNMAWPKIEPCFHFLMDWRKIVPTIGHGWMTNYLRAHNAYVHPGVNFEDLDKVNFSTLNIEKMKWERSSFVFPPSFKVDNPSDVAEVIMIYWKK